MSLEEADAEAQGKKPAEGEAAEGAEEEVESKTRASTTPPTEDVTDIVGDVDDEEETEGQEGPCGFAAASRTLVSAPFARYNSASDAIVPTRVRVGP